MLIAQITDTHILAGSSNLPVAETRAEDLRRCVADIQRLDPQPDAVIHTGDTVQTGSQADYDRLVSLLAAIDAPVYLIPGNRDHRDNLRAAMGDLARDPLYLHYSVEDAPVRLVALDSIDGRHNQGVFGADRQRWLDETLAAEPDRPTIVFMHHPPFDVAPYYSDGYREPADQEAIAAIIDRHPQVRRLMCGHCHCSSQRAWAGTAASTMASVALDVRKGVDATRFAQTPMYQLHTVSADGDVQTQTRLVVE